MFVLMIIGIIMLIVAIVNWGQSEDFFQRFKKFLLKDSISEERTANHPVVAGSSGGAVIENDDLEDYAYDDDSDYLGNWNIDDL